MKTIRMKKADWQKWDTALRSGEYDQAAEVLYDGDNGYCCLGVLQKCTVGYTEISSDEIPTLGWLYEQGIAFFGKDNDPTRNPFLPTLKRYAADANDELLRDEEGEEVRGSHKYSFVEIADAIKEAVEFIDT